MIQVTTSGSTKNMDAFLRQAAKQDHLMSVLHEFGAQGVRALAAATPIDSGETASSWSYEIVKTQKGYNLIWKNSHQHEGALIAILLQYGHGTRNGGYVQGRDYINPAMQHIFDQIADESWKAVNP